MAKGDHVMVSRGIYRHHGIDMGDGNVVHYTSNSLNAEVKQDTIASFAAGAEVHVVKTATPENRDEICRKAKSRIGERKYDVVDNNCEHFSTECTTGKKECTQVENIRSIFQSLAYIFGIDRE